MLVRWKGMTWPMIQWIIYTLALFTTLSRSELNLPDFELLVLRDLYDSTNGEHWRWNDIQPGVPWNFAGTPNPCADRWEGIVCSNQTITIDSADYVVVVMLDLVLHEMKGQVPDSIGLLSGIVSINLAANSLSGTIPAAVGNLSQLVFLNISENHFTGTIPEEIGRLQNLELLDLSSIVLDEVVLKKVIAVDPQHQGEGLSGTLPDTLANLSKLRFFSVGFNELKGSPAVLGALTELEYLFLYLNRFTGPIPASFNALQKLRRFSCGSNYFTGDGFALLRNNVNITQYIIGINAFNGTIPDVIGERTGLVNIDFSYNLFNGSLPDSFASLTSLELFNLANNTITGTIPTFLCEFTDMLYIDLALNNFHSTIPECLKNMRYLQFLDVSGNALTGTISSSLGELSDILHFNVGENELHGTVPAALGNFSEAYLFDLAGNRLTGTISPLLGAMRHLQFLNLSGNLLTGKLLEFIAAPELLATMDLSSNLLQGSIPPTIGFLSGIQYFYVQNNLLSGTLPVTMSNLTKLQSLLVDGNRLTGPLTGVFNGSLQRNLSIVQVSDNQFTGQFPDAIFELPRLQTLVAVVNCFHGSLPLAICDCTSLTTLALDGLQSASTCQEKILPSMSSAYLTRYQLNGGIPQCLFALPNLAALHLSGNGLTGTLSDSVVIGPVLRSLSLSNNILTGSIPRQFQDRAWAEFDLSFNHLSGKLLGSFSPVADNASVSLQTNRLSGKLPSAIIHAQDISVLKGNLFACDLTKQQLPDHDSDKDHYVCGSVAFDAPYYMWLAAFALVLLVLYILWLRRDYVKGLDITATTIALRKYYDFPLTFGGFNRDGSSTSTDSLASASLDMRLRNCKYICELMDLNCKNTLIAVTAICLVLLIYYPIASPFYSTHEYVYAYKASAAFVSGTVPFAVEFLLFTLFLVFVLVLYRVSIFLYERAASTKDRSSEIVPAAVSYFSPESVRRSPVYLAYFLINFMVVLGVNIAFIYISLYDKNEVVIIAQILLSVFKLMWNNVLTFYALVFFVDEDKNITASQEQTSVSRVFYMQLFVMLLNNIAIPCLVVAAISPGCFYNVFIPPPEVDSTYQFEQCVGIVLESGCNLYTTNTATVSYHPPYSYSYQCSSSFVKNYAPAFIYMCFTATFLVPLVQLGLIRLHRSSAPGSWLWTMLGNINQYPVPEHLALPDSPPPAKMRWHKHFNANQILLNQLNFFGILMTFGVVFPPLAAALAFTICAMTLFARIKVGYFLSRCVELNQLAYVDKINAECTRVVSLQMIRNSVWMLIAFSACFYTLFLFDTLGDAVGFDRAYWVLIVTPLLPLFLYAADRAFLLYAQRVGGEALEKTIKSSALFEIVLSPLSRATAVTDADLRGQSDSVDIEC